MATFKLFQHECYLHARIPRIKPDDGSVVTIKSEWCGKINGFTLLFEAFLVQLCIAMSIHSVSKLTGVSDYKLWHLLEIYVTTARNPEDLSYLHSVGMDETSVAKGHDYITLFVDLQNKKTVYVADGKGNKTVKEFAHEL
jgi:transposase